MEYLKSKAIKTRKQKYLARISYCKMNLENLEKLKENFETDLEGSDIVKDLKTEGYQYLYIEEENNKISVQKTLKCLVELDIRKEMVLNYEGEWELKSREDELLKIIVAQNEDEASELIEAGYEVFNSFAIPNYGFIKHIFHMRFPFDGD